MNTFFLILITLIAFISTNLDDLFVLMAFFTKKDYLRLEVILGQYLGMISLILISSLAYFFQLIIPNNWIGFLGIIPIIIGVKNLLNIHVKSKSDTIFVESTAKDNKVRFKFLQVGLVTFANGGDNIGVYAPLFAGINYMEITQVILIFMLMTGLWCIISIKLVDNQIIGEKIMKYGHLILPLVLIGIGIIIILRGVL